MWYVERIVNHRIGNRTQNKKIADSQGWTQTIEESQTEKAYDGSLWEKGYAPKQSVEEQNEAIRATRESLYMQTSDKLKADYDEAVARGADNAEELKIIWLESKDKIREENPYVVPEPEEVPADNVALPAEEPETSSSASLEDAINSVLEK